MAESDDPPLAVAPRPKSMKPPEAFESQWSDPPPPIDDDDLLIGQTLQRTYQITRIIGEGGMGRVYEATHTRIERKRYAIKVLHPEYARQPEIRARFKREAETAASISHPNVVGVHDVAVTKQGWPFLVCEFLQGQEYASLIRSREPDVGLAVEVALQICDALIVAHSRGVIHRDLKPQNIFLVGDEHKPLVKVLDFGLSRFTDSGDNSLTKTGMIMGTPSYMAPEQARGERTNELTDVYGLGAILYASVTGQPPFNEATPQATLLAAMNVDPPRPHTLNPNVSVGLELVIQKAMAKRAEDRYPNMKALRTGLLAVRTKDLGRGDEEIFGSTPNPISAHSADASGSRTQLLLLGSLGLVLLIAGLAAAATGAVYVATGGWPLTRTELILSLLVIAGTLITPAVLMLRKLAVNVWRSTAKVVDLLHQVRAVVIAGLLTYGLGSLGLRFVEGTLLGTPRNIAWPGWSVFLFIVAVISALLAWVRVRSATVEKVALLGPGLYVLSGLGCAGLLYGSLQVRDEHPVWPAWQAEHAPVLDGSLVANTSNSGLGRVRAPGLQDNGQHDAPNNKASTPSSDSESTKSSDEVSSDRSALSPDNRDGPAAANPSSEDGAREASGHAPSTAELSSAIAAGASALEQLAERYPENPQVLRALVMAHGSRAATLSQAMQAMRRLFGADPESIEDKDLQVMISRTSAMTPPASELAYQLMAEHMGTAGTDLLYKLSLGKNSQRQSTLRYLAKSETRKNFSSALAIAFDLRNSSSCKARLPLLKRAEEHGDVRSIQVLSSLANGTDNGCGNKKRKPCKPPCPIQAERFRQSIEIISRRGS